MLEFYVPIQQVTRVSKTQGRSELSDSDAQEIQRLSSSPSFLRLADSILTSFDRDTLAEFLAGYLYFESKGGSRSDYARFLLTKKFGKGIRITMKILAALIPGLLFDKAFRSVVFGAAANSFGKSQRHSKSAASKDD